MADALVVIDIQNEYFPGGAVTLPDAERAASKAAEAIEAARRAGVQVIHIRHEEPDSDQWFVPGVLAQRPIAPSRRPRANPSSSSTTRTRSSSTDLAERLTSAGASRVALRDDDLDVRRRDRPRRRRPRLDPVLVDDACAAPDLEHRGRQVAAESVHAAFCAALGDEIATVLEVRDFAAAPADA